MPDALAKVVERLALANRILAHEGVLDAFGHISVRHPNNPKRYLRSRSRAPSLVEPDDILEYTLDSEPVKPAKVALYSERVIHGCIDQARTDVMAVCRHHAPAIMPFCIAGKPVVPVFHLDAAMGEAAPLWDQHDEFGDTNLPVIKQEEGQSLARALALGAAAPLHRGEIALAGRLNLQPNVVARTWEYWSMRLAARGVKAARRSADAAARGRSKGERKR